MSDHIHQSSDIAAPRVAITPSQEIPWPVDAPQPPDGATTGSLRDILKQVYPDAGAWKRASKRGRDDGCIERVFTATRRTSGLAIITDAHDARIVATRDMPTVGAPQQADTPSAAPTGSVLPPSGVYPTVALPDGAYVFYYGKLHSAEQRLFIQSALTFMSKRESSVPEPDATRSRSFSLFLRQAIGNADIAESEECILGSHSGPQPLRQLAEFLKTHPAFQELPDPHGDTLPPIPGPYAPEPVGVTPPGKVPSMGLPPGRRYAYMTCTNEDGDPAIRIAPYDDVARDKAFNKRGSECNLAYTRQFHDWIYAIGGDDLSNDVNHAGQWDTMGDAGSYRALKAYLAAHPSFVKTNAKGVVEADTPMPMATPHIGSVVPPTGVHPTAALPKGRSYVFMVERDNEDHDGVPVVMISSSAFYKREGCFDDQSSESDERYHESFGRFMEQICGDIIDEVCESSWGVSCTAVGGKASPAEKAAMDQFIAYLRQHPSFKEIHDDR